MTRARILELLEALVLELANKVPPPEHTVSTQLAGEASGQAVITGAEWAYVKGLAAGAVIRLRAELGNTPR